jgi:hypothetical protein
MSSNPNSPAQRQLPGRPSGGDQTPSARNASVFRLPLIEPTTIGAEQTGSSDQPGSETSHSPLVTSTRQPTFETYTNASAKDAKDLSKAFVAAKSETAQDLSMMAHKLAKNDLHSLGRQRRLEERLGGIQEGHTLSNISNQVRHRLMSDMRAAGREESELECIEESPLEFEVGERQLVFNKAIAEETESAEVPEDLEVPVCDCGVPCVYRQYNADPTSTMWVCSLCQCMFFQALTSLKVIETPAGDAVIANMFNDQNLESFWATVGKQMAFPAKQTIDLLLGTVDSSRRCVCDQPCTICICSVTGAVFWVCKTQTCFYILPFDEKQIRLIDNMDVGQLVPFGDSTIDRYTTLGHMMKWFGYSFSVEFFAQLNAREPDADYPKGSFLINPGQQFDGFISYRGGTGRYPLFFTLLGLFNLFPAVVFLYVVCPLFMIPMAYAYDLCEADDPQTWLIFANSCDRAPNARSWFVFRPYAPSVIVLIVLFWHPVMSFAYANRRYFLDKYC